MTGLLRIGSRKSALARTQAEWVAARVPTCTAMVWITSEGDQDRARSLASFGGVGVFTRALNGALREDRIDAAVHSLKDLPTRMESGIHLAVVSAREDPRDALVARDGLTLDTLPEGARIGTGSPRRVAQLKRVRPDVVFVPIRGNVPTRIEKVNRGEVDAVVLACAGLRRLALDGAITQVLDPSACVPAAGQGALGITIREDDAPSDQLVAPIRDVRSAACATAERTALHELGAGCHTPMGALAVIEDGRVRLHVRICDVEGTRMLEAQAEGALGEAAAVGADAAAKLRKEGAEALV